MRSISHRLMCLNIPSAVDGTVCGCCVTLRNWTLLEKADCGCGVWRFIVWPHSLIVLSASHVWIKYGQPASCSWHQVLLLSFCPLPSEISLKFLKLKKMGGITKGRNYLGKTYQVSCVLQDTVYYMYYMAMGLWAWMKLLGFCVSFPLYCKGAIA